MRTVWVYDAINPQRLLGTMKMPDRRPDGRDMQFSACPGMASWDIRAYEEPFAVETVRFTYSHRVSADGWDQVGILLTHAPLKTLMSLREFRLPGEDERQAYQRQRDRYW